MSRAKTAASTLAIAAGLVVAAPAWAQDATRTSRTVTTAAPAAPSERDDAAKTMPTYEAFGASDTDSLQETFSRLSRDFASTSEIGVRRLGSVPIWPRGDMKIGNVRILPFVREGFEYDSNFFQKRKTGPNGSPQANEAAYTHVNQAGFLADTSMAGGRLKLASSVDAEWDVRYDDDQDDTFELLADIAASYRFPSGAWVRGGYEYERNADPIDVDFTGQFNRHTNRAFLTWGVDRDIFFGTKFRFEMGAAMRDVVGRDENLEDVDRTEMNYYFKASYPFLRDTTRIFGRARYRQDSRQSDEINDGYVWGFDAGIEGSIPISEGEYRGLRGQVGIGFDSALYDNDTFDAGSGTYYSDTNRRNTNLAFNVLLQYLMSRKSTVNLRYIRSNQFTFHGNYQVTDRVDADFTHQLTQRLQGRIGTFFEYADPSGNEGYDEVGKPPSTDNYPSTTRFGAGFGLRYAINDWADADFRFDWERRNNSINGFVNHSAEIGFTVYLNAIKPRARSTSGAMDSVAMDASTRPVTRSAPSGGSAPTVSAPAAAAAVSRVAIDGSGFEVEGGTATSDAGKVLRLRDASSKATLRFDDGSTVDVAGPAVVRIVEVTSAGRRIQLISGSIPQARVKGVALEIQTPADASLVLQNAAASAKVAGKDGVTFQGQGGEFARVYQGAKSTDLGTGPWSAAPGK